MQVERIVPAVTYKLELTAQEYTDIKRVMYFAKTDTEYDTADRERYRVLSGAFAANV